MAINLYHRVVESLEEAQNLWLVSFTVSETVGDNRSVAFEVVLSSIKCSLVNFFIANSNEQHIGWVNSCRSHHLSLKFGLWEVLEDPAMLETVLLLSSLDKKLNNKVVVNSTALLFHKSSQFFALARIEVNVLLNNFIHVEVYALSVFRERFSKFCLATFH